MVPGPSPCCRRRLLRKVHKVKDIYDELLEAELSAINWRHKFQMALLFGLGVFTPLAFAAGIVVGVFYVLHK